MNQGGPPLRTAPLLSKTSRPSLNSLLGTPIVFSERSPALGSKGDLMLLNLSYYLILDGSGPFAASSEHILFLSNQTVFRISWNFQGKPWLSEPLALEGATNIQVSPFVVLN